MVIWARMHPLLFFKDGFYGYAFVVFLKNIAIVWSSFMFWFMFAVSMYWYIVFKLESRVYVLLFDIESESNMLPFWVVFGIAACFKVIILFVKICEQSDYDIIFMDREQPRTAN